jgi:hypothetical protein
MQWQSLLSNLLPKITSLALQGKFSSAEHSRPWKPPDSLPYVDRLCRATCWSGKRLLTLPCNCKLCWATCCPKQRSHTAMQVQALLSLQRVLTHCHILKHILPCDGMFCQTIYWPWSMLTNRHDKLCQAYDSPRNCFCIQPLADIIDLKHPQTWPNNDMPLEHLLTILHRQCKALPNNLIAL